MRSWRPFCCGLPGSISSGMSNSAPQHRNVNRFGSAWGVLEDEVRDIVVSPGTDIEAVWAIAGTIYRDETNPASETPQQDFADVVRPDPF